MKMIFATLLLGINCKHVKSNDDIGKLPALKANPFAITTSGCSSGGYMSQEMHVIYSKNIKGSFAMGSGPYMVGKAKSWYTKKDKLV